MDIDSRSGNRGKLIREIIRLVVVLKLFMPVEHTTHIHQNTITVINNVSIHYEAGSQPDPAIQPAQERTQ